MCTIEITNTIPIFIPFLYFKLFQLWGSYKGNYCRIYRRKFIKVYKEISDIIHELYIDLNTRWMHIELFNLVSRECAPRCV